MNFLGDYKLSKTLAMNEKELKMEFVDAQAEYERQKAECDNPHDLSEMERMMMTTLTVTDDEIVYSMPIPENVTAEEIKEAEEAGMIVDGKVVFEKVKCKVTDGELYMYDESKFLAGTEWVKISTEVEGELNLIMAIWKAV